MSVAAVAVAVVAAAAEFVVFAVQAAVRHAIAGWLVAARPAVAAVAVSAAPADIVFAQRAHFDRHYITVTADWPVAMLLNGPVAGGELRWRYAQH